MDEIQQARDYGEQKEAEGFVKGETAGFAKALVALHDARGIAVTPKARSRIDTCKDPAALHRRLLRGATAASLEDVFAASTEESV